MSWAVEKVIPSVGDIFLCGCQVEPIWEESTERVYLRFDFQSVLEVAG